MEGFEVAQTWSTARVLGQPGLRKETLSPKQGYSGWSAKSKWLGP